MSKKVQRVKGESSNAPAISLSKIFFRVKLENIKFLHVNNMWVFTLFIEKDMSEKL